MKIITIIITNYILLRPNSCFVGLQAADIDVWTWRGRVQTVHSYSGCLRGGCQDIYIDVVVILAGLFFELLSQCPETDMCSLWYRIAFRVLKHEHCLWTPWLIQVQIIACIFLHWMWHYIPIPRKRKTVCMGVLEIISKCHRSFYLHGRTPVWASGAGLSNVWSAGKIYLHLVWQDNWPKA